MTHGNTPTRHDSKLLVLAVVLMAVVGSMAVLTTQTSETDAYDQYGNAWWSTTPNHSGIISGTSTDGGNPTAVQITIGVTSTYYYCSPQYDNGNLYFNEIHNGITYTYSHSGTFTYSGTTYHAYKVDINGSIALTGAYLKATARADWLGANDAARLNMDVVSATPTDPVETGKYDHGGGTSAIVSLNLSVGESDNIRYYSGVNTSGATFTSSNPSVATVTNATQGTTYSWNLTVNAKANGSATITVNYTVGSTQYYKSLEVVVSSAATYTVTFNPNLSGASVNPTSKTVTQGEPYGTLPTPVRSGYSFTGWFTSASGGTEVTSTTTVSLSSNQTLYAHWTGATFTITFNANTGNTPSPTTKAVTNGGTYGTLATVTKDGYDFDGWYTAASGGTRVTASTTVSLSSNQTLYAHWSESSYRVTFNANGGTVSPSYKNVVYNNTYGTLPTPTLNDYRFDGWFTSATGGTQITASTTVTITAPQTLYAHWTYNPSSMTGHWSTDGTTWTQIDSLNLISGQSVSIYYTAAVDVTGSTFTFTPSNVARITDNTSSTIYKRLITIQATTEGDTTLRVDFSSGSTSYYNELPVHVTALKTTFYRNYDSSDSTVITTYYQSLGQTFDLPSNPTRDGYEFKGWWTSRTGGTQVTSSTTVTTSAPTALYAHWDDAPATETGHWSTDGSIGTKITSLNLVSGQSVSIYYTAAINVTDSEFSFWPSGVARITDNTSSTIYKRLITIEAGLEGDTTLRVDFEGGSTSYYNELPIHVTPITTTFYLNYDSSDTTVYTTYYQSLNQPYSIPSNPSRDGFGFNGWWTARTGGTQVTESTTVTMSSPTELYAHWTANEYTVTLNPNGGTVSPETISVTQGEPYGTIPTPTFEGCTFEGWFTDLTGDTEVTSETIVDLLTDTTLYAHWTGVSVTVTFNPNGGTLIGDATKTVEYTKPYGELPTASKDGVTFGGWFTASEGGDLITAESIVDTTEAITLYAHWDLIAWTITLNANGGSVSPETVTVYQGQPYGAIPTPTRLDYAFLGWWTSPNDDEGVRILPDTIVDLSSNQTLYAHWTYQAYLGDVWWDNKYVNGSVNIAFHYPEMANNRTHTVNIPLMAFDGIKDDGDGVDSFSGTKYVLSIKLDYPRTTATVTLKSNANVIAEKTTVLGTWADFLLSIDMQNSVVRMDPVRLAMGGTFSFTGINTYPGQVVLDYSRFVTGLAASKVYHLETGDESAVNGPNFQVVSTTTYLDTYGFVMTNPTLNIHDSFPNYENLRLNFYSFAVFGDSMTVNGMTFQLQGSTISNLYYTTVDGKNILASETTPDAIHKEVALNNIYVTWTNIGSTTASERMCYLTFVNDNLTIEMGTFSPTSMVVSFGGVWYFTTSLYEPYNTTETTYEMNWNSWFNMDGNTFLICFLGLIIAAMVAIHVLWRPLQLLDFIVIGGAGILIYTFIGGF